jgi:hypothetical protein
MRRKLAGYIRVLAYLLDRTEYINARWHRISVDAMNRYIGKAERYIVDLEMALGKERTETIRKQHPGRYDTKPMCDKGVWN